jgi:hypothetical protein
MTTSDAEHRLGPYRPAREVNSGRRLTPASVAVESGTTAMELAELP